QSHGYTLSLNTTVRADRVECWRSLVHRESLNTAGSGRRCHRDILNADGRRVEDGESRGDLRGTHDHCPAHRDSSSAQANGGSGDEIRPRQSHGYTLSLDPTVRADRAEGWRSLVHRESLNTAGSGRR